MGKISTLIKLLKEEKLTLPELVEKSGASPNTVKIQIKYLLPKKGLKVVKEGEKYFIE